MDDATQAAAAVLLRQLKYMPDGRRRLYTAGYEADALEATLIERVEQAQADLRSLREARAFRLALDALMPGWVDVDASEFLPRDQWDTYVSNSPEAWLGWLTEQGVPDEDAARLVADAFGEE